METYSLELVTALRAAKKASELVMKHFGGVIEAKLKADASPVTEVDVATEHAIVETLRERFPHHRFVGEETGDSGDRDADTWVIDPIDGTKNFMRGIPLFGIQIALVRDRVPVVGVSAMPAMGELLYAERGKGAYLNGKPVRVNNVDRVAEAHVTFGGLTHFVAAGHADRMVRVAGAAARVRGFGDAYAYHLLATGRCDAVLEAKIRFWDVAALSVAVEAAGGKCTDLFGQPIGFDMDSVLFTNGKLHAELMEIYGAKTQ
jgi:histidinol-phosphatase